MMGSAQIKTPPYFGVFGSAGCGGAAMGTAGAAEVTAACVVTGACVVTAACVVFDGVVEEVELQADTSTAANRTQTIAKTIQYRFFILPFLLFN